MTNPQPRRQLDWAESGYDISEFVEPPPEFLQTECPVCLLVLRNPYITSCCGYNFCKGCIDSASSPCPRCKKDEFTVVYNRAHDDLLKQLEVYCRHRKDSCEWKGKIENADEHLREECLYCEVECSFSYAGCKVKLLRKDMAMHERENVTHMALLSRENQRLLEEIRPLQEGNLAKIDEKMDSLAQLRQEELDEMRDEIRSMFQRDMDRLENEKSQELKKLSSEVDKMKLQVTEMSERVDSLQTKVCHELGDLSKGSQSDCTELKDQLAIVKSSIQKLHHHIRIAPIQITMGRFEQQRRDNRTWYSDGFYTHPHGYKVCLSVTPNGKGEALGKSVSVIIYLMRGEFDNHLTWPLRGNFVIELRNQRDNTNHQSTTISFNASTADRAAGRVTNGDRAPVGWGYISFVPHTSLDYNSTTNSQHLVNNSLCFQVSFEQ